MTSGTIHRSAGAGTPDRGEPILYGGQVIGYTGDVKGVGANVREAGAPPPPPIDQLKAYNQRRSPSSRPAGETPPGSTLGKAADGQQVSQARAQLAMRTARIRAQQGQRRAQGQSGGGAGSTAGRGAGQQQRQEQQQQRQPLTQFTQRAIQRIADFTTKIAESIGKAPTYGSNGLLLLILLFFWLVVVKVSASGTLTRAQLIYYTLLGQASLPPASSGGPGKLSSQTVAQITTPQPVSSSSPSSPLPGSGLAQPEQQSNQQLARQQVAPVGPSPRPTRLPPMPPAPLSR